MERSFAWSFAAFGRRFGLAPSFSEFQVDGSFAWLTMARVIATYQALGPGCSLRSGKEATRASQFHRAGAVRGRAS
jgi:hypothetical protein